MATKTISITEEAYDRLVTKKSAGESFSDIIIKITGGNKFLDGFGVLSNDKGKSLLEDIKKNRKIWLKRGEKLDVT